MNTTTVKNNDELLLFKDTSINKYKSTEINISELTTDKTEILLFKNYKDVFSISVTFILYLLSLNTLHFNDNNISEFLKQYSNLCDNFYLSNKKKIYCLFKYYKS